MTVNIKTNKKVTIGFTYCLCQACPPKWGIYCYFLISNWKSFLRDLMSLWDWKSIVLNIILIFHHLFLPSCDGWGDCVARWAPELCCQWFLFVVGSPKANLTFVTRSFAPLQLQLVWRQDCLIRLDLLPFQWYNNKEGQRLTDYTEVDVATVWKNELCFDFLSFRVSADVVVLSEWWHLCCKIVQWLFAP